MPKSGLSNHVIEKMAHFRFIRLESRDFSEAVQGVGMGEGRGGGERTGHR